MDACPCGSNAPYSECCAPLITGARPALAAEQLMRSRYSAYVKKEIPYLLASLHPGHRSDFDEKSTRSWAEGAEWRSFTILNTDGGGPDDTAGTVEFTVTYAEEGVEKEHHELSSFKKEGETWYFVSGKTVPKQVVRATPKIGRNDPCPCGSGKKFKKCCG